MNDAVQNLTDENSKPKCKFKRRHIYLIGSVSVLTAFAWIVAEFGSRDTVISALCGLGTLTMIVALAAFFKAYEKN